MNKIKSLLGFAAKAGKLFSGTDRVIEAVRFGKAELLVLAEDASAPSAKKFKDKAAYYDVPLIELMSAEELSKCIGKINRVCVAIVDKGFAASILREYEKTSLEVVKDE